MILTVEVDGKELGRLDVPLTAVVKIDGRAVSVPEPTAAGPKTYTWAEIVERPGVYRHVDSDFSDDRFIIDHDGLQIQSNTSGGLLLVDDIWKLPHDRYIEADEKLSDVRITFSDHRELLAVALEALELCTGSFGHHDTGKAHRVVPKIKKAIASE